ncbi:MAG: ABC transporter ATP-binding protein [Clostridiales bacterium]|nr:ABC transporter ATP-binding protein [Clostridiales bacterium]
MKKKNKVSLIKYLKPYWYFAILSPLFMVAEVLCDLLQPTLMSTIVDKGVIAGDSAVIISTGLKMLMFVVIGGITGLGAAGFASAASQSFGNDLRCALYNKVMHLSISQTDSFTIGSLVTRLTNDVTMVQELVASILRMFIRSPIMFVGGIIMCLSINAKFSLVLACALPVQIIFIVLMLFLARPMFKKVQQKLDKVNSVVQENVSGARVVKAYVREEHEKERFDDANTDLMMTNLKVMKIMSWLMPCIMIVMNVSIIAVILIGGYQVDAGKMGVGEIMAAVTYISQILMSIMMVGMMFQTISRGSASAARIKEVLASEPTVLSGDYVGEGADSSLGVEFRNVSFSYHGEEEDRILHNISFSAQKGKTTAILGATGSGKSTLIKLIPRFYDADEGEILLNGTNVKDYSLEDLRYKIGFVLQKSELFSGTIAENIRWGDENATDSDVIDAARIAQADDFIMGFSDKYETAVSEKGASLSGGQKQRMSIARAILKNPDVLIMDDSTSALDLTTEARLQAALKQRISSACVIIIAQRVASIKNADNIIVLDNGTISAQGTHEELLKTSEIYKDIYNSQMKTGGIEA